MKKTETKNIKTVQDIFELINSENVNQFCKDFNTMLFEIVKYKESMKAHNPNIKMSLDSFDWIDDNGERNGEIQIITKPKK